MYTFLACGEELHTPDSYSVERCDCCTGLWITSSDSTPGRYLYHIIWQFKIIIFHSASCHPRVQMGPSKVRENLIKCWRLIVMDKNESQDWHVLDIQAQDLSFTVPRQVHIRSLFLVQYWTYHFWVITTTPIAATPKNIHPNIDISLTLPSCSSSWSHQMSLLPTIVQKYTIRDIKKNSVGREKQQKIDHLIQTNQLTKNN